MFFIPVNINDSAQNFYRRKKRKYIYNMGRMFWKFMFWLTGWKIEGSFPNDLKKAVIVAAPHTSNWDFPLGLGSRSIGKISSSFMIKDSWIKMPIVGWAIKAMGGVAVDRSQNKKIRMTEATISEYKKREQFVICIAPEGTRKKVDKLKTGFWHIAKEADVPLVPISFDYATKTVFWNAPFYVTDDKSADIEFLKSIYRKYKGKFPQQGI